MPQKGPKEDLTARKARLLARCDLLRDRAGEIWSEAERPARLMEEGIARLRRIHPWMAGAGVVAFLLLRQKLMPKRRLLASVLPLGWMILDLAARLKSTGSKDC